jgi:hypothetical protein
MSAALQCVQNKNSKKDGSMEKEMFHGEGDVPWRRRCFMEKEMFHGEKMVPWRKRR